MARNLNRLRKAGDQVLRDLMQLFFTVGVSDDHRKLIASGSRDLEREGV